ncbi:hypothetical protein ACJX0J_031017, partial [Zea mays]
SDCLQITIVGLVQFSLMGCYKLCIFIEFLHLLASTLTKRYRVKRVGALLERYFSRDLYSLVFIKNLFFSLELGINAKEKDIYIKLYEAAWQAFIILLHN